MSLPQTSHRVVEGVPELGRDKEVLALHDALGNALGNRCPDLVLVLIDPCGVDVAIA